MASKLTAAQALALWLQEHEPNVFEYLLSHAKSSTTAPEPATPPRAMAGLGDWSSVLTSLSSDLSTAVSDVGNYLSSSNGQSTINGVISQYLGNGATAAQGQVLQTQAALAASGQGPAPIGYQTLPSGQVVPVYTGTTANPSISGAVAAGAAPGTYTNNGQFGYALTPALTASLAPQQGLGSTAILLGAGALAFAYLTLRRPR